MKHFKTIISMIAIVVTTSLGFCLGRTYEYNNFGKADYEAACHLSDVIRSCQDWYAENDSMSYNAFDETLLVFLDEYNIDLSNYVWGY